MDGTDAARVIRSFTNLNQFTQIIAVTAYDYTSDMTQQFDEVLQKPVTRETMAKVIFALSQIDLHQGS